MSGMPELRLAPKEGGEGVDSFIVWTETHLEQQYDQWKHLLATAFRMFSIALAALAGASAGGGAVALIIRMLDAVGSKPSSTSITGYILLFLLFALPAAGFLVATVYCGNRLDGIRWLARIEYKFSNKLASRDNVYFFYKICMAHYVTDADGITVAEFKLSDSEMDEERRHRCAPDEIFGFILTNMSEWSGFTGEVVAAQHVILADLGKGRQLPVCRHCGHKADVVRLHGMLTERFVTHRPVANTAAPLDDEDDSI